MPALGSVSNQKALGTIAETTGSHVDGVSAFRGTNLYSGDVVETDNQGVLRLRLGSGQLYLSASSSASFEQHAGLASVTLARGTASFSLPDPLQFELETPAGTLRGSGTHATSGQVTILSSTQIVVSASHGDLILDNDGELNMIPEGKAYRIIVEQDESAPSAAQDETPQHARRHRRKLLFFLIGAAAIVAATIPLWHLGSESQTDPR
jgi:ferric-dicitrate binding protein FerR (iron transport regulator)